ncbi:hypothetical protein TNCV_3573021 [Trichonephila clavipes]|nr:hypothetical protein TNCV_3573021 [Trichonephila clavipes]
MSFRMPTDRWCQIEAHEIRHGKRLVLRLLLAAALSNVRFLSSREDLQLDEYLRVSSCRTGTIHLKTSIPLPGFKPRPYGTVVSVTNWMASEKIYLHGNPKSSTHNATSSAVQLEEGGSSRSGGPDSQIIVVSNWWLVLIRIETRHVKGLVNITSVRAQSSHSGTSQVMDQLCPGQGRL